ncbi:MAG: nuclease (SNase domain protein) [Acidimicrobiales bacterium]|nr:nuclease (SNase domain protein) [Acidimicrobiales bacterium]
MRRALNATLAVALLVACSRRGAAPGARLPADGRGAPAVVVHIVDGDTVHLRFGSRVERVRLLGMDTPETVKPGTPVQCFGPEASARMKALLPLGSVVRVRRDIEARDRYGRLLLYLWRATDGLFVNLALVQEGYARPLPFSPNFAHRGDIAAAADEADRARRGLWAACSPPEPPPRQSGHGRSRR